MTVHSIVASISICAGLHATFGRDASLRIARRWRPVPFSESVGFGAHQNASIKSFCRAAILFQGDCHSVIQLDDDASQLHMFILEKNDMGDDCLRMCMWGGFVEDVPKKEAICSFAVWYASTFPGSRVTFDSNDEDASLLNDI